MTITSEYPLIILYIPPYIYTLRILNCEVIDMTLNSIGNTLFKRMLFPVFERYSNFWISIKFLKIEIKTNYMERFFQTNFVYSIANLMICGISLPLNAREINRGISKKYHENQNTANHILLILKCYIYRCRCKGEIQHLHRGFEYINFYIKIDKNPTFYVCHKQKEEINIKQIA